MDFGKIIKEARIRQGMSQLQLAEKIGYTQRSILYWEKGKRRMTLESADKVFKALHLSVMIGEVKQDEEATEENYCEIINDQCPYDFSCSLCRLRDDYDSAKALADKLKDPGRWEARTLL